MTLRVLRVRLEKLEWALVSQGAGPADLQAALARIAARSGIGDPERASFAQLLAVRVFGDGGRCEDRSALDAQCRRIVDAVRRGRGPWACTVAWPGTDPGQFRDQTRTTGFGTDEAAARRPRRRSADCGRAMGELGVQPGLLGTQPAPQPP